MNAATPPDESSPFVSPEQARELDARYGGFPKFDVWAAASIETTYWEPRVAALDAARSAASPERIDSATRAAMKAAALDTGVIEGLYPADRGFTIAVATQAAAWDTLLNKYTEPARDLIRAQLSTYELALDVATKQMPVNEALIRRMHEELTGPQETYRVLTPQGFQEQPLPRGQYKTQPNHVRLQSGDFHAFAPVDRTAAEMHLLVQALTSEQFASAHPVIQAAYSHYAFVAIHPFADGNGRVARALASIYLYRSNRIPLLVPADERDRYLEALRRADTGDPSGIIEFTFERAMDTMQLVESALAPDPSEDIPALRGLLQARGAMTHDQMNDLGVSIMNHVHDVAKAEIATLVMPAGVVLSTATGAANIAASVPGYRNLPMAPGFIVLDWLASPAAAVRHQLQVRLMVVMTDRPRYPYILDVVGGSPKLEIRLDEVRPAFTTSFDLKLTLWLRARMGEGQKQFAAVVDTRLHELGYR
jgi:Fic family protein